MMVTIKHVRAAGICSRGARAWVASKGLSWATFLDTGFDAEFLRATGDPIVLRAVAQADKEVTP